MAPIPLRSAGCPIALLEKSCGARSGFTRALPGDSGERATRSFSARPPASGRGSRAAADASASPPFHIPSGPNRSPWSASHCIAGFGAWRVGCVRCGAVEPGGWCSLFDEPSPAKLKLSSSDDHAEVLMLPGFPQEEPRGTCWLFLEISWSRCSLKFRWGAEGDVNLAALPGPCNHCRSFSVSGRANASPGVLLRQTQALLPAAPYLDI
mmetsp:Transcript_24608/g.56487  ORF Transcript_24608/g.56487 Transcript_24608/m.56487 type:complete len:209 (+) Transcript_24608:34-660(+)